MRCLSRVRAVVHNLVHRGDVERELDEEIISYVDLLTAEKTAEGLSPAAARRAALIEADGVEQIKERVRDVQAGAWVAECGRDIRYAVRMLRRSPGFTVVAVLTLALGVGANTAVFAVINGVLLRSLPFPEPERLFLVSFMPPVPAGGSGVDAPYMRDVHYLDFRGRDHLFQHLATYSKSPRILVGAGDPAHVVSASTTDDFFAVLGVSTVLGRGFVANDVAPGYDHVVVIGDALWRTRFGGDGHIVGRTITLDGIDHEVIGVMPPGFAFPPGTELWTPFAVRLNPHLTWSRVVVGRLKPGVTDREARAEIEALAPHFSEFPTGQPPWRADIAPLKELLVANARSSLQIFAGAVVFVLLIACANVANLLLTRATGRRHEMAVRATLGANRARLIRQTLTESAVLSLTGGAAGILLSIWAVRALLMLAPSGTLPRLDMVHVDGWVLPFTLGISLLTGLMFGIAPALRATDIDLQHRLSRSGRTVAGGRERLRDALAVGEIALALVLVTGAGLLLKSFLRLRAVDPGFHADHVTTLTVDLPAAVYNSRSRLRQFHSQLLGEFAQLPDVSAVGAVNWLPPGNAIQGDFRIEGDPSRQRAWIADKLFVSPGYFQAMGIRLLRGRDFTERDDARAPAAAIISESVARQMWPGQNPIGQRLAMDDHPTAASWFTVIGVVDDVKQLGLGRAAHPAIYQSYLHDGDAFVIDHMTFVVRSTSDPSRLIAPMQALLRRVDPNLPGAAATMGALMARTTAEPRFQTRLIGIFAGLALALAVIGIYGVLAYSVAERTKEIGIRIALGARMADVMTLVLQRGLMLTVVGVILGAGGAFVLTRQLTSFLFEVTPHDPATFGVVVLLVMTAGLVAAVAPARSAKQVDPMSALRTE
jgi:predicted permease